MTDKYPTVHPYDRSFPWTRVSGFRQMARNCAVLVERRDELREMFDRALPSSRENDPNRRVAPAHLVLDDGFWDDTAVLYSCLAIEGFLNDYGVRRLGQVFYARNLERLSPTQKVSVLIATCRHQLLPPDAPILATVRRLFEARNRLVHPKTVVRSDFSEPGPSADSSPRAAEAIAAMESFFSAFEALDPDTRASRYE